MTKTAITTVASSDCSEAIQSPLRSIRVFGNSVMKGSIRLLTGRGGLQFRGRLQVFEQLASGLLLSSFFRRALRPANELGLLRVARSQQTRFHCERLAVLGPDLFHQHIGWLWPTRSL